MVIQLSRAKGAIKLLDLAFGLGGLHRVFALLRIKVQMGKGDFPAAIKGCSKQIHTSDKVRFWSGSASPRTRCGLRR